MMEIPVKYIEERLISAQPHPKKESLIIYNYTPKCQFSKNWDDITKMCRGLILDGDKIIARPFPKFFNYGEEDIELPAEKPIITEKYDGSLGILYWLDSEPYIATRGSFISDQAEWATRWFRENVEYEELDKSKTYLFEIIYPENRIVVQYDFSGLVLLAVRDTETGKDEVFQAPKLKSVDFMRIASQQPYNSLDQLKELQENNAEGFVILYPESGLRLKIKFDEYVRLHRILTGISNIAVWEYLRDGKSFDEFLEKVPDEFYKWLQNTISELRDKYAKIEEVCKTDFEKIPEGERKEKAEYIIKCKYPSILFSMLDGKDYSKIMWRLLRPQFSKPFKEEI